MSGSLCSLEILHRWTRSRDEEEEEEEEGGGLEWRAVTEGSVHERWREGACMSMGESEREGERELRCSSIPQQTAEDCRCVCACTAEEEEEEEETTRQRQRQRSCWPEPGSPPQSHRRSGSAHANNDAGPTHAATSAMAQAAKHLRKNKDLEAQLEQERKEKEEERFKKRSRSRDKKRKSQAELS
ncbi:unnamed protein product [Pleuronectes platessa]|uniref:Uncharacterized protein n=1 Tax=Pleuronectes platessa TaxID=8262 RepID=A0A9N7YVK5_PLEPL|nr:unnamed protein product [Pleuronectes platessa]